MDQEGEVWGNPSQLERAVEQKIHQRTCRRVKNLRAELINGQIVVHGSTKSYYVKVLAIEAAREVRALICPIPLLVDIQVT
jgi:hypothetical protein